MKLLYFVLAVIFLGVTIGTVTSHVDLDNIGGTVDHVPSWSGLTLAAAMGMLMMILRKPKQKKA